jgi:hypothetical protein
MAEGDANDGKETGMGRKTGMGNATGVRSLAIAGCGLLLCVTLARVAMGQGAGERVGEAPPDYRGQKFEVVGDGGPETSPTTITAPAGFTSLTTVAMYPVLYCGEDAGGGTNEYPVRPGAGPVRWLLEVPSPPAGGKIFDVRYEPYDNIAALTIFAQMLVQKVDETHISITARVYPNCAQARVRLRVTVSYAK